MTTLEVLAKVAQGELSADEASGLLAQNAPQGGLLVKRNAKGGLFMRNTAWKAHSADKDKEYTVAVNIPWEFAKPFFSDPAAVSRVVDFVKSA